ncbi:hypothetical protein GCM10023264_08570 [Sphingomonas daechungensis]|uniref:DUF4402 domain-containing protein n=1 Tax=Sphingomonas daechungensis TaxID=1176646 RepID=A0ABX6T0R2_9SPHN|nr:DUF4402 domain-containing protein [Sphingomonas daechungensis]QNP43149.1 DUF4402 domain-containing protein [Sphingomonas daechungensis]
MNHLLRKACLAASVASASLIAVPAVAAPVGAATPATGRAKIVKPLVLTSTRNLDFGTITLGTIAAAGETVAMTQAGVVTCGSGGLTCSGTPASAAYNVKGTNNQVVQVFAVASALTNANDGSTLSFTPSAPATVTMPNSGTAGVNFNVGGSIKVMPATTDGVYSGNINVTVDYQ